MNSINNMSIAKPIIASGLVVPVGVNNLDLYIPKVDEKYSEEEIKFMFADMSIGMVSYVDFVATKDPETKQVKFYSAFLRLREWNPDGFWYNKIIVEKQNKIQVSRSEFWVILPAKTPLSRSKVNTHQLAAYTDELYVRVDAVEKSVTENMTVSSVQFQNLLAKSEAQASQIEQLMKIVELQSKQIKHIEKYLMENEEPEIQKPRSLTIEDLASEDLNPVQCEVCSNLFDTKKQLEFHSMVCKKKEQTTVEQVREEAKSPVVFCDDECFFFKPLQSQPETTANKRSPINKKSDIISGSFSYDLEEILGPVAKSMGLTKEQTRKGLEKEFAKSQRAKSSKNFCGNA
jgi:hypothetical protein